ncbi:MAG: trypsin-like peptidase domain-containing protein [Chloroflexota bacterium]|nr:trypsin-like peptidase domain-containing protein [Chloroflexota bacterium]
MKVIKRITRTFAAVVTLLLLTLACAPQFSPGQAPPEPVPGLPLPPNIEATVEAMVTERVREALAAIPTVTPAPTATPVPTATPQAVAAPKPANQEPSGIAAAPSGLAVAATPLPTQAVAHAPNSLDLADMVNQVKPGVVRVNTADGVGSGIIFEKLDGGAGLVLTNYHVVEDSYRIDVLVGDNRTFRARMVGFDQRRDLAVLEMCCDDFPTLELMHPDSRSESGKTDEAGTGAGPVAGTEVVAIGYALGLTGDATVTRGIVSAVRYHPGMRAWVIQTDASINPGNSGGPLLLPTGEVIGITTFLQNQDNRGNPTAGLGFAISERSIRGLLPDLKEGARNVMAARGPNTVDPPSGSMEWQTYTSPTHRYTVDVPVEWILDDSDQDQVHFDSPDRFAGLALLSYDKRVEAAGQWIDDVVGQHTGFYRGQFQLLEREIAASQESRDGGSKIAHIVFRARVSQRFCVLRVTEVFHRSSGGNFVASFHICEHSYSGYSAVQQAVLSSIKLP